MFVADPSNSPRYFLRTPERICIALKQSEPDLKSVTCELNWILHTIERTGGRTEPSAGVF